jgi:hypothetical protein
MPDFGPVHTLIVREVGEPYGPFDTGEFADFEVEHPPECKRVFDDQFRCERFNCAVEHNIENAGARWLLFYTGTPVNEPGIYRIRAWSDVYRGFDYVEHDGGIGLVSEDI